MKFFEELPVSRSGRRAPIDWAQAKTNLIANPGAWGMIAENVSSSTPGQLRKGKNKHFRGEELEKFEFVVRRPSDPETGYAPRRSDLYGRFTA